MKIQCRRFGKTKISKELEEAYKLPLELTEDDFIDALGIQPEGSLILARISLDSEGNAVYTLIELPRLMYYCSRCGHVWFPHKNPNPPSEYEKPKLCPQCHSAYWDRAKTVRRPRPRAEGEK